MTMTIHRETAKIYQFPVRLRRRLEDGRTVPTGIHEVDLAVVDINCWYHDDAVRDAAQAEQPKPF